MYQASVHLGSKHDTSYELLWYTSKVMIPTFGTFFSEMRLQLNCTANRKVSSEDCWIRTHISFWNTVQLHLQIFWSCICVLWSCICNSKAAKQQKWFPQMHVIFIDMYRNSSYAFTFCSLSDPTLYVLQCHWTSSQSGNMWSS